MRVLREELAEVPLNHLLACSSALQRKIKWTTRLYVPDAEQIVCGYLEAVGLRVGGWFHLEANRGLPFHCYAFV